MQKVKKEEILTEAQFVRRQIFFLLKLPFLIIAVLFGKIEPAELLQPWRDFIAFIFQAKITLLLILANIAVFILQIFTKAWQNFLFKPTDLLQFNFFNMIASWFLHAGLAHLLGNLVFLFVFGRIIEKSLGKNRLLLIYFGSAIIASVTSASANLFLLGRNIPGLGASGAIAGLVATAILLHPFYVTYLIFGAPIPIIFLGWLFLAQEILGILNPLPEDNIGHFAHLGGFLAITILAFFFSKEEKAKLRRGLIINLITLVILALVWLVFGLRLIRLWL